MYSNRFHHGPARYLDLDPIKNVEQIKRFVIDGLNKLAVELADREDAKIITATSWLVRTQADALKRLGFTVMGEVSPERKQKYFSDETRPVWHAEMTKEQLLKLFPMRT